MKYIDVALSFSNNYRKHIDEYLGDLFAQKKNRLYNEILSFVKQNHLFFYAYNSYSKSWWFGPWWERKKKRWNVPIECVPRKVRSFLYFCICKFAKKKRNAVVSIKRCNRTFILVYSITFGMLDTVCWAR